MFQEHKHGFRDEVDTPPRLVVRHARWVRFAVSPNDPRLVALAAALDRKGAPAAETWRQVGAAADRLGLPRPSYGHVRRILVVERRRRELREEAWHVVGDAASAVTAGRVPSAVWTLQRLRELQLADGLVLQEHKARSRGGRAATEPGRRSRGP